MSDRSSNAQQPARGDLGLRRRPRYRRSRLMRFRSELVAMRRDGSSLADLSEWLRQHRIQVSRSTILRALRSWPEAPDA